MHSLKNTFVAVTLLVISFGLYQVSLTPDSEVATDVPDVEISYGQQSVIEPDPGSDAMTSPPPAANSIPPSIASSGKLEIPGLPDIEINQPASEPAALQDRQPLIASSENNVQTIEYPEHNARADSSLPDPVVAKESPEVSQREIVDQSVEAGLIDALENQKAFEAAMSSVESPTQMDPVPSGENPATASADTAAFAASPASGSETNPTQSNPRQSNQLQTQPSASPGGEVASVQPPSSNTDASQFAGDSQYSNESALAGESQYAAGTDMSGGNQFGGPSEFAESTASPGDFTSSNDFAGGFTASPANDQFESHATSEHDSSYNQLASNTESSTEATPNISHGTSSEIVNGNSPTVVTPSATPAESATTKPPATAKSTESTMNNPAVAIRAAPGSLSFREVWPVVDQLVKSEDYRLALEHLTHFYHDTRLTGPQRQRLLGWLDALAGKVIFSDEHHLAGQPYEVKPNESLADIGTSWQVPSQLVYNVNQRAIPNPAILEPGAKLKQIPGPFHAEIDLEGKVMTLFLGKLYAGRFPVRVGISGEPKPGSFKVILKSEQGHTWRDSNGNDYPPGSPENGYGPNWLGLTGSLCIHAVDETASDGHHGCIGLTEKDAKDVFAIMAENSEVTIIR